MTSNREAPKICTQIGPTRVADWGDTFDTFADLPLIHIQYPLPCIHNLLCKIYTLFGKLIRLRETYRPQGWAHGTRVLHIEGIDFRWQVLDNGSG